MKPEPTPERDLPEWRILAPGEQPGTFRLLTLRTIRANTPVRAFELARKRFPAVVGLAVERCRPREVQQ